MFLWSDSKIKRTFTNCYLPFYELSVIVGHLFRAMTIASLCNILLDFFFFLDYSWRNCSWHSTRTAYDAVWMCTDIAIFYRREWGILRRGIGMDGSECTASLVVMAAVW